MMETDFTIQPARRRVRLCPPAGTHTCKEWPKDGTALQQGLDLARGLTPRVGHWAWAPLTAHTQKGSNSVCKTCASCEPQGTVCVEHRPPDLPSAGCGRSMGPGSGALPPGSLCMCGHCLCLRSQGHARSPPTGHQAHFHQRRRKQHKIQEQRYNQRFFSRVC